ncbi:MAG TPA: aminotransferase class I/II-fold pyridoxal phosphate-dependent enzyme [Candidatus Limnocylindrales bacterium]|nr:aminotransferase class I/II-fold pyridoxal phosphate-dependent enzyme [Candidatus Limnocylindrales bacterium]
MRIRDFGVEIWMNRWETRCLYNLAETCVDSVTTAELLDLAGLDQAAFAAQLLPMRLGYGEIEGSARLRAAIAAHYDTASADDVIVAHGAIGANALAYQALVEPGDVVIPIVPTYQQHTAIPESLGAEVRPLRLREEDSWLPDTGELRRLARGGAKVIAVVNPHNPTGALLDEARFAEIVAIAREAGAWLLADEVYRGIDQAGPGTSPSFVDRYERTVGIGSMSKAFSLAGLRLGWIVAPGEVRDAVSRHRDYSVISVGMVDDLLASIALEAREPLLARNRAIVRENLAILDAWVHGEPRISYVRPAGGTTALLRYDLPVRNDALPGSDALLGSEAFCLRLLEAEGVLLTPGSAMDVEGYLRIGYANETAVLHAGLARFSAFLVALEG